MFNLPIILLFSFSLVLSQSIVAKTAKVVKTTKANEKAVVEATNIKMAVVTPEGSSWTKILYEMKRDLKKQTKGEIDFSIYAGGVSGDEIDVIRKMRVRSRNQIHAAGFSGVGLGVILPEIRILESPLLFNNNSEVDYVRKELFSYFANQFEKKGYIFLGYAEAGDVYLFSKRNINLEPERKKIQMWIWKGDKVAETFFNRLNIHTYPLNLANVNTGLETGMIDSFYSPPLAAIAFQWYPKVSYILDYPVVNSIGAFLMKKSMFNSLSLKNKKILLKLSKRYCDKIITSTRRDNQEALSVLKEAGLTFLRPSVSDTNKYEELAHKTYKKYSGKIYPMELFNRVNELLKKYRQKTSKTVKKVLVKKDPQKKESTKTTAAKKKQEKGNAPIKKN